MKSRAQLDSPFSAIFRPLLFPVLQLGSYFAAARKKADDHERNKKSREGVKMLSLSGVHLRLCFCVSFEANKPILLADSFLVRVALTIVLALEVWIAALLFASCSGRSTFVAGTASDTTQPLHATTKWKLNPMWLHWKHIICISLCSTDAWPLKCPPLYYFLL